MTNLDDTVIERMIPLRRRLTRFVKVERLGGKGDGSKRESKGKENEYRD